MPPKSTNRTSAVTTKTGNRQPTACKLHGVWQLQIRYAPRTYASKLEWARSTDKGYDKTWATEEAAIAAKAHFKKWVDDGRSTQQRAAQAASTAARAKTVETARANPRLPVRFRGGVWLESAAPTPVLSFTACSPTTIAIDIRFSRDTDVLVENWRKRSAQVVDRRKRRRFAAEAAADSIPSGVWEDFFTRCRKAARRQE
eukprot:5548955-Prymnesium_polylepis.1